MKNAVITLTILVAAAAITATYLLWTRSHVAGNFTESFGPTASTLMLKNAVTPFPGCPTDMNSSWQTRQLIVAASALSNDSEDGDEKKGEGSGKDEEKEGGEDQGIDRLWDACKCG